MHKKSVVETYNSIWHVHGIQGIRDQLYIAARPILLKSFFVWLYLKHSFPYFAQAARVNSVSNRMKKIALEMRVFGYKNSSQLELDSFILFISQARMKVNNPRSMITVNIKDLSVLLLN